MTRFGVQISTAACTMAEVREAWARVEALGFEWISGQDHFYTLRDPTAGTFEGLTTHAALAASSTTPRVGCLVYAAGYRHPAVLANALVTIDHLSGGRLEAGIGAGWLQAEYDDYGLPFESPGARLRRMREAIEIIRSLWTNDTTDYDGEFYRLRGARCDPPPVQRRPRIWVGAKGPRALRVAAEVGDGWNANFVAADAFARGVEAVKQHAPDPERFLVAASVPLVFTAGADVDEVIRARYGAAADQVRAAALAGSTEQIADGVGAFVDAGADWLILALRPPFEFDALEHFATSVVPRFRTPNPDDTGLTTPA
jgi:alkanesulfonate monooxygenase SsuD/methylene tetrahydromethanopterin reductase-like flavin-dependent oxidoreductase (luciferase family)